MLTNKHSEAISGAMSPKQNENLYEEFIGSSNCKFYDTIIDKVNAIPTSNGCRYYKKLSSHIGIICDEFFYNFIKDAANFIYITPENWQSNNTAIDFLFVVSAWHGLNNEWNGIAEEGTQARKALYNILSDCNRLGKKVIFYSKEAPSNYDYFIEIAQKCDFIITSCAEKADSYRHACHCNDIRTMCFGVNPQYHNPIGCRIFKKPYSIIFSGSHYSQFLNRIIEADNLLDSALRSGFSLNIIDRCYYDACNAWRFAKKFWRHISPSIEHLTLQKVHKLYDWAININTVTDSATMFANRAYELSALGTLIISNYSVGMNYKLPNVFIAETGREVSSILNAYTKEEIYEYQMSGVRGVMTGETCFDRLSLIMDLIGKRTESIDRSVAVVINEINESALAMFRSQTYKNKTLIPQSAFCERTLSGYDMISFWDKNMKYEMFYLEDMINGFKYTNSDYITKDSYMKGGILVKGVEHNFVCVMKNKYRSVFWASAFTYNQLVNFAAGEAALPNGYSIDHLNYDMAPVYKTVQTKYKYNLAVIIPVYNNGRLLYTKAFASLLRSSIFCAMEILLIDDGSTDSYTPYVIKYLADRYNNIVTYFYNDGGSGSASRPRNKGVELSTTDYITFLDPDNEAINDGYSRMLKTAIEENDDIVVGNVPMFTSRRDLLNNYRVFSEYYGSDVVSGDKKEFLKKIKFIPMSIQAMIIHKSIITTSGICQVVGAVGQDSFFSWQLFVNSRKIKAVDFAVHIYYAMVQNSTVNTITTTYFQRALILESAQKKWLVEMSLLESYMQIGFNDFFRGWYLEKLSHTDNQQRPECTLVLLEIFNLYCAYYDYKDEQINKFLELARL